MEAILVFSFFVGASDAGCKGAENIGGASGKACWCGCGGGHDVFGVEAEAICREFSDWF